MKFSIESREWYNVLKAAEVYNDEAVLQLKKEGMLMRVQDKSQTGLYNTLIPADLMEEYEIGEYPKVGIHVDDMKAITPNDSSTATVELEQNKIRTTVGSRDYTTPPIDPENVSSEPESVPNLDMPVKIWLDPDRLIDYIKDAHSYVYNANTESGHYFVQAQEGTLILWAKRDDYELTETFHWEDFEDYDITWSDSTPSDGQPGNPAKEKKIVTILSIPLTKGMEFFSDTVKMEMGHGMPLKMVSESESGVKHSWIVPPRFPREDEQSEVPERVIKERNLI